MNAAIRYQNSILGDCLEIMTTNDLLEFACEVDWISSYVGQSDWLLIKSELGKNVHLPWRDALESAIKSVVPSLGPECLPQQN